MNISRRYRPFSFFFVIISLPYSFLSSIYISFLPLFSALRSLPFYAIFLDYFALILSTESPLILKYCSLVSCTRLYFPAFFIIPLLNINIFLSAEGTSALEESWYVTPPACFTQVGPVIVETSPMENLLIEHPSMSVYHATTSRVAPDTPPPTPDTPEDLEEPVGILLVPLPLMSSTSTLSTSSTSLDSSPDRGRNPDFDEFARRAAIHDDRPFTSERNENRVRIATQLRSAQKVLMDCELSELCVEYVYARVCVYRHLGKHSRK